MSRISDLYNEISKYNTLKVKLISIVDSLNSSSGNIADLPQTISNTFSLDETDTSVSKKCKKLNNDIVATSNHIKNVVIPGIDNAIYKCRYNIAKLEAEENAAL